jgi:hypothetical protein
LLSAANLGNIKIKKEYDMQTLENSFDSISRVSFSKSENQPNVKRAIKNMARPNGYTFMDSSVSDNTYVSYQRTEIPSRSMSVDNFISAISGASMLKPFITNESFMNSEIVIVDIITTGSERSSRNVVKIKPLSPKSDFPEKIDENFYVESEKLTVRVLSKDSDHANNARSVDMDATKKGNEYIMVAKPFNVTDTSNTLVERDAVTKTGTNVVTTTYSFFTISLATFFKFQNKIIENFTVLANGAFCMFYNLIPKAEVVLLSLLVGTMASPGTMTGNVTVSTNGARSEIFTCRNVLSKYGDPYVRILECIKSLSKTAISSKADVTSFLDNLRSAIKLSATLKLLEHARLLLQRDDMDNIITSNDFLLMAMWCTMMNKSVDVSKIDT